MGRVGRLGAAAAARRALLAHRLTGARTEGGSSGARLSARWDLCTVRVMRLNQPKSRAKAEETPTKANESASKPEPIALGHPIFGTAPVAIVTVTRIRYRNGDPKAAPIRTPLPPIAPERLIDLGVVGTINGPGRYDLRAVDERGVLAWRPETVDCPDEEGNLHLVAPMPPPDANAPASGGTPVIQKDMIDIYKDIASQAEKSRANDFQAFVKIMEAQNAGRASGGGSELVAFLQGELQGARALCGSRSAA